MHAIYSPLRREKNNILNYKTTNEKRFAKKKKNIYIYIQKEKEFAPIYRKCSRSATEMSVFFFRLHNLRRQAEEARKKRQRRGGGGSNQGGGQRGGSCGDQPQPTAGSMQSCNKVHRGPSNLFERTPLQPSDSLDEIAFQIPR